MKVLECSSKGDKGFSAFYARVNVFGKLDSIENHYQLCKRFGEFKPVSWKDSKGKKPSHINIGGIDYEVKYLSDFYKLLWCSYLDSNPELVKYAELFDDYNDMFKGKSVNCQADVIRKYVKEGRKVILEETQEFRNLLIKGRG